jgi:hypothetical protein
LKKKRENGRRKTAGGIWKTNEENRKKRKPRPDWKRSEEEFEARAMFDSKDSFSVNTKLRAVPLKIPTIESSIWKGS